MLKALMVFLILLIVWLFYRSLKKRSLWKNAAIPRQQTIASQPRRPLPSGPRKLPQGCASWPAETRDDARQISDLAQRIWSEAFRPFLPEEQINYMLRKFQSWIAIQSQFSAGVSYRFILNREGQSAGYYAWETEGGRLHVSKLFLLPELRGRGLGRAILEEMETEAESLGLQSLYLLVNRQNQKAIRLYQSCGYRIAEEVNTPIGGGFTMEDYRMEKNL